MSSFKNFLILAERYDLASLKKRKVALTDEERERCIKANASKEAVWKTSDSKGKTLYVTNTHRCFQVADTLDDAIEKYHSVVKDTA